MKKFTYLLFAFIALSCSTGRVQASQEIIKNSTALQKVTYTIDLGDLTDLSRKTVKQKTHELINTMLNSIEPQECTLKVQGHYLVNKESYLVETSLTGKNVELAKSADKVAKNLIEQFKSGKAKKKN